MGFDQDRPIDPKTQAAEVRRVRDEDLDKEFWKLYSTSSSELLAGPQVQGLGAIRSLTLPDGWSLEEEKHHIRGAGYRKTFALDQNNDVKIEVAYRGAIIAEADGGNLLKILARDDHKLEQRDLASIRHVLGFRFSNSFAITYATTQTIGGRRVLFIEGHDKSEDPLDRLDESIIFIPADRKGQVVQTIAYSAPHDLYGAYRGQFRQVIATLELN